jgi:hypothetical protein
MPDNLNESALKELEINDFDFIYDGAESSKFPALNFLQFPENQKCNCGKFSPKMGAADLKICGNCKWAKDSNENLNIIYCSKRKIDTNIGK